MVEKALSYRTLGEGVSLIEIRSDVKPLGLRLSTQYRSFDSDAKQLEAAVPLAVEWPLRSQMSVCSASVSASSTSTPKYRTVFSIFV
jgi:hypothetical protein